MTLIDRLSKLDRPSGALDREICKHLGLLSSMTCEYNHWPLRVTSSVDAAIALAERVFPGWTIARLGQDDNKRWNAELRQGHLTAYDRVTLGGAPNGAIALCIALLRAKEAFNGE